MIHLTDFDSECALCEDKYLDKIDATVSVSACCINMLIWALR